MRAFTALLRKELRTYFGSPLVYLVAAAFLAYTGYYFHSDLIYFVQFGFGFSIMENFWQLVFVDVRLVLMLAIPLLTMRLLAEERRLGTLELLLTYPVSDGVVVAAKLGACLVVIGLLLGCTLVYPLLVWRVQEFPLAPLIAGYVGLALLGAMAASYGLFVSSLTESQVLAGFLTAMPLLLLWLLSWNEAANAPRHPAAGPGGLALQPLPALLGRHHRPARRLLLPLPQRLLRVGHAPGAGGQAMARPALTWRGQALRIALAIPALIGIFFLGQALLDARSWRIDLTPGRRYTLSEHARQVLGGLDRDVRVLAFLRSQDPRNPLIDDLLRQVRPWSDGGCTSTWWT